MKKILFSLLTASLVTGCAQFQRAAFDAGFGAGGAVIANQVSHGNAPITAGGAAAGVLLSEGLQALQRNSKNKSFQEGYQKGRSDAAKKLYWEIQQQQHYPLIP